MVSSSSLLRAQGGERNHPWDPPKNALGVISLPWPPFRQLWFTRVAAVLQG